MKDTEEHELEVITVREELNNTGTKLQLQHSETELLQKDEG